MNNEISKVTSRFEKETAFNNETVKVRKITNKTHQWKVLDEKIFDDWQMEETTKKATERDRKMKMIRQRESEKL